MYTIIKVNTTPSVMAGVTDYCYWQHIYNKDQKLYYKSPHQWAFLPWGADNNNWKHGSYKPNK